MDDIKQQIITEFSSAVAQEMYKKKALAGLWETENELIDKYFESGSFILDLGCGTGRTTIPLSRKGYKTLGLDITPEMIQNAIEIAKENNLKIEYEIGDAVNLKYPDNFFDNAIFSNNGWTQVPGKENRLKVLREVYRTIKSGGCFIFTTHIRQFRGFEILWTKQWIKIYILKRLGFKIREIEYGDRFFNRETNGVIYKQRNFIHIPKKSEVINQIKEAGFKLIETKYDSRENILTSKDKKTQYPMFYVCKK